MSWINLNTEDQLSKIKESEHASILFKHSTRCFVSRRVKKYLEQQLDTSIPVYYLDLLAFRTISTKIEEVFKVKHESPQLLIINNGECIFNASHEAIDPDKIKKVTESINN